MEDFKPTQQPCLQLRLVLKVYWNWLVQQIPLWVAPNLLTWVGLMVNVITTGLAVFYNPTLEEGVEVSSAAALVPKKKHTHAHTHTHTHTRTHTHMQTHTLSLLLMEQIVSRSLLLCFKRRLLLCFCQVPSWVFLLCALGIFIYQSLDNIDGKQARRTGMQPKTRGVEHVLLVTPCNATSSTRTLTLSHARSHTHSPSCYVLWLKGSATPLGELFDHGCDSVSTSVIVVGALVALQGGSSMLNFITVFQAVCLFYFAHWECYVKGRVHFNM